MNLIILFILKVLYWGWLRGHYATFLWPEIPIGYWATKESGERTLFLILREVVPFILAVVLIPHWAFLGSVLAYFIMKKWQDNEKTLKLWNGIHYPGIGSVDKFFVKMFKKIK